MRNPYVVEVKTEDQGIFANTSNSKTGVTVKSFDTFDKSNIESFNE